MSDDLSDGGYSNPGRKSNHKLHLPKIRQSSVDLKGLAKRDSPEPKIINLPSGGAKTTGRK